MISILVGCVETSDQMGTSENIIIGVFNNERDLNIAKEMFKETFHTKRVTFLEKKTDMNRTWF